MNVLANHIKTKKLPLHTVRNIDYTNYEEGIRQTISENNLKTNIKHFPQLKIKGKSDIEKVRKDGDMV